MQSKVGSSINAWANGNAKLIIHESFIGTFSAVVGERKAMNCLEQGASKATSACMKT